MYDVNCAAYCWVYHMNRFSPWRFMFATMNRFSPHWRFMFATMAEHMTRETPIPGWVSWSFPSWPPRLGRTHFPVVKSHGKVEKIHRHKDGRQVTG